MRDRRAHRTYTPEQIKRRAQAIKKKKFKTRKKMTNSEKFQIALVILIIGVVVVLSYLFGIGEYIKV